MNKEPFTIPSGLTPVLGLWCGTCAVSVLSHSQWQMPLPASEAGSSQLCLVWWQLHGWGFWVLGLSLLEILPESSRLAISLPLQENELCQMIDSPIFPVGSWQSSA